jgi:hypothetical protein
MKWNVVPLVQYFETEYVDPFFMATTAGYSAGTTGVAVGATYVVISELAGAGSGTGTIIGGAVCGGITTVTFDGCGAGAGGYGGYGG